jgi:uncharacterized protein YjcR
MKNKLKKKKKEICKKLWLEGLKGRDLVRHLCMDGR